MNTKGRPKTETTLKIEKIASKSGLTLKYLRQLHRDQGMPLEPLQAALQWLENRGSPAGGDDDDSSVAGLRKERIRLVRLQAEAAQLRLEIERSQMIARDAVREQHSVGGHAVRAMLMALELGLPPLVIGKTVSQVQEIIRAELRKVMTTFQDSQSDFWKDHPAEKPN